MSSPPPGSSSGSDSGSWLLDAILVPVGIVLLILYSVIFYYRVKKFPLTTVVGVNHVCRRAWVRSIMSDIDKKNILAVQSLRNSIMASTLMASTAMLLAGYTATFVASSTNAVLKANVDSFVIGYHTSFITSVKFFLLLLCFIFSFMCHVQCIRYTNHVNFLISIPQSEDVPGLSPEYIASLLARGSNFYTVGTRGFYFAFPFLLWLFGPIPFIVMCAILVVVLHHLDTASGLDTHMKVPAAADATSDETGSQLSSPQGSIRRADSHKVQHGSPTQWGEVPDKSQARLKTCAHDIETGATSDKGL